MKRTQGYRYEMPERMAISEASRVIGVSITTLRRWETEGLIRPERTPGGQRRYRREDVERLLDRAS